MPERGGKQEKNLKFQFWKKKKSALTPIPKVDLGFGHTLVHVPLLLDSLVQIKLWKSAKLIFLEKSFDKDKSVSSSWLVIWYFWALTNMFSSHHEAQQRFVVFKVLLKSDLCEILP